MDEPRRCSFHQKKFKRTRIFVFLAGLNSDPDEVRGRILGHEPLPTLHDVFFLRFAGKSRHYVM
ncbi:hypothetical protein F511_38968 [Dorcoceras hygrometricum]|uniref:Uncharacterized protein n=1 Tax=Dorcoceras hygrometricum TaxID=472368 RepID=A0A2Z7BIU5_9LAMI|nr:hypothetical protein F511_38968 [Dorcoceras hygrometricum]